MVEQAEYGLGAFPSPVDTRDLNVELDTAVVLPSRYIVSGMGPLLNQRDTPYCGGYSGAGLKQHQDKADGHGIVRYDPVWLYQRAQLYDSVPRPHIGTNARGVLKALHKDGCRVASPGKPPFSTRIASYASVAFGYNAIKRAIYQYRSPVLIGSDWFTNWFNVGVLPRPSFRAGGHLYLGIGWNDRLSGGAIICRNSWGRYPNSINGNFYAPWLIVGQHIHDEWKALDVRD